MPHVLTGRYCPKNEMKKYIFMANHPYLGTQKKSRKKEHKRELDFARYGEKKNYKKIRQYLFGLYAP